MPGTRYSIEVQPIIPPALSRLVELANDLLYSWDRQVRSLFYHLDRDLWESCGHCPKVFLRRVSQHRLVEAAADRTFMEDYHRVLGVYDAYHNDRLQSGLEGQLDPEADLVAYFCAEFGFHESLPIYSGGLGILAGDHCKAASDLGIPFLAVGLLYRQGYFTQTIDGHGNQVAHYHPTNFGDLPITPAVDDQSRELRVAVEIAGRTVQVRVWRAKAGHIRLYLLDTDLPENTPEDRSITYQLYGGDISTRIQQEIVLGIGGVRALRALGRAPTVWHINEGHAAFLILERCREYVELGKGFDCALELTASNTVFTTHTPVPAGHDRFEHDLMRRYFGSYAASLGIPFERFLELGASAGESAMFNQTALALRGSRHHNGVSGIHGRVASRMESYVWPQISPDENPIRHITNGVHVPTFLAQEWVTLFDMRFGREWRNELRDPDYWERIDQIPNHAYWSLRQSLKTELLHAVRWRCTRQHRRNGLSEAHIERLLRHVQPESADTLVFGFARRFATYKRATLLFRDPDRLARLLTDPKRPALLIFAGKAHPRDVPGQDLIREIHRFSQRPEFAGRIILLEGYDLALARKLVTGVDVWVNTPAYPLEASGTSGQKAALNGVINLSVADGWWAEGYNGSNGWTIKPHETDPDRGHRDHEEGEDLLDLIEHRVIPLYYDRNGHGYSDRWVAMSKASTKSILPRFNAQRMVTDYVQKCYGPAAAHHRRLLDDGSQPACEIAQWKRRVAEAWPKARLRRVGDARTEILTGEPFELRIAATLGGLTPDDVRVECLFGKEDAHGHFGVQQRVPLQPQGTNGEGEHLFATALAPPLPGLQHYHVRMFPHHELLAHPFEHGWMVWL